MFNRPLPVAAGKTYEAAFELTPWQAARHAELIRLGALDRAVQVSPPPKRLRKAAARLAGRVFHAADVAPAGAVSKAVRPGRWMITDESASRSPRRSSPTAAAGHRRSHSPRSSRASIASSSGPARPTPRCLNCPASRNPDTATAPAMATSSPFALHLGARKKPGEIDFGVALMDEQTVSVGTPPTQLIPACSTTFASRSSRPRRRGAGAASKLCRLDSIERLRGHL